MGYALEKRYVFFDTPGECMSAAIPVFQEMGWYRIEPAKTMELLHTLKRAALAHGTQSCESGRFAYHNGRYGYHNPEWIKKFRKPRAPKKYSARRDGLVEMK